MQYYNNGIIKFDIKTPLWIPPLFKDKTYGDRPCNVAALAAAWGGWACAWAATATRPAASGFEVSVVCPALETTAVCAAETTGKGEIAAALTVPPWVAGPPVSGDPACARLACATAFANAALLCDCSCEAAKALATALSGYPALAALFAAMAFAPPLGRWLFLPHWAQIAPRVGRRCARRHPIGYIEYTGHIAYIGFCVGSLMIIDDH